MLSSCTRLGLFAAILLPLASACGGASPAPATPAAPTDSSTPAAPASSAPAQPPAADATPVPTVWSSDLPKPQAVAFMKANVVPRMKKAFQGHDAAKYANFDCKTCHGPEYKVPKDYLPRLTFAGGKVSPDKPEVVKFMHEVVVPEMAAAMGQPPYDPATGKGFGCGGCHAVEMK
jgi:cytochrome c553